MKQKSIARICGLIFSIIVMVNCTTMLAFAQSSNNLEIPTNAQVIFLDDGYKIVLTTETVSNTRGTTVTRSIKGQCLDNNNNELAWFTTYGEFDSATGRCVNHYYRTSAASGLWRTEQPVQWNDGYTVHGSCEFVKRVLGIKVDSISYGHQLSYRS